MARVPAGSTLARSAKRRERVLRAIRRPGPVAILHPLSLLSLHQGAAETGNVRLDPDPRHTPGCGYNADGTVATSLADPYAELSYDPVTQTVGVDAGGETEKDAVPANLPAGYGGDHTRLADLPHNAHPLGEGKEEDKAGGGGK